MEQPLVSVIVPVYNASSHVARCLESIRKQTYKNLEIIVVNDGSQDASLPVCQMFARVDERIVLIDQANSGVSATRNLAIGMAKGKYLQFVDSDDYLDPNATQLMVDKAEGNQADMVIAHYFRVERVLVPPAKEGAEPQEREVIDRYGFLSEGFYSKVDFAKNLMQEPASFYYGVMWNKLYRADIVREHPDVRCNEELDYSEDLYFNLSFIRYAQQFYALSTPIYNYVQNPDSAVHHLNPFDVLTTRFELTTYYKDLFKHIGLYEENKYRLNKFFFGVAES